MKHSIVNGHAADPGPARSEIASLALKFYQDDRSEDGGDRKYWLWAEYMLTQKRLIECQINGLRNRRADSAV